MRFRSVLLTCVLFLIFFSVLGFSDDLEVVAVMYGHANEGTWDPAAYQSLLKAQKTVPFKLYLNETTSTQDAEKVIRNWAGRGVNVVYAHSGIYINPVLAVAKQFPKVIFLTEMQLDPETTKQDPQQAKYAMENTPANFFLSGDSPWEGNYMAGYAAALMTKTNKLGILQPFESPGLNRYSNSFYFGAKAAKKDVEVNVIFIGDYIAPAETRDGIISLAQKGCDVILTEMDDNSAILEAANQGIYIIPMYIDKSDVAPKTVLTSVVMDWSTPIGELIKAVAAKKTAEYRKAHYYRSTLVKDGSIYLGKWAPSVPEDVKKKVMNLEEQFKKGTLQVPIEANSIINK